MMTTRWEPFRDLLGLQNAIERSLAPSAAERGWRPSVDIVESEDALIFRAELPGVVKEQIEIRVEDDVLHLEGERKSEAGNDETTTHRRERAYGRFSRRFTLPPAIDASRIEATHRDGVLEIVLPKLEQAKPRKIEIRAA